MVWCRVGVRVRVVIRVRVVVRVSFKGVPISKKTMVQLRVG